MYCSTYISTLLSTDLVIRSFLVGLLINCG